ncbi:hypothetical protein S83_064298 [Arachis hypogaea]
MICVNRVFAALCSFVPLCFPSLASFTCGLVLSLGPFRYPCRRYVRQVALPLVPGWFLFNCRLVAAGCCGRRISDVVFSTLNIIMKSTFERTPSPLG